MNEPTFPCWIKETKALTPEVWTIAFDVDKPLNFEAGQYINVVIPAPSRFKKAVTRNYSICSPPEKSPIELCFELVGKGPGYLSQLKEGDIFEASGPYGGFTYKPHQSQHLCYIGTGSGIGPFRSMIQSQNYKNAPPVTTTCILEVKNEREILYCDEMEKFNHTARQNFIPVLSDPSRDWTGEKGNAVDCIRNFNDRFPLFIDSNLYLDGIEGYPWNRTAFYLCGDAQMVDGVTAILRERGVSNKLIHQEIYFDSHQTRAAA